MSQYLLQYDAADGSIFIVTDGPLINYVIESTRRDFLEDADFNATTHQRLLAGTGASTPSVLSESNPFAPLPAGTYSLGQVLPPGLQIHEFVRIIASDSNSPTYVTGLGQPKTHFVTVWVPEPSSLAMLGFSGCLVLRRRGFV